MRNGVGKISLILLLFLIGQMETVAREEAKSRQWKSAEGQHSTEGKLVDFDKETGIIKLQMARGDSIDVEFQKLSKSDQKYVIRFQKNVERQQKIRHRRSSRQGGVSGGVVRMYGVEWVADPKLALQLAGGKQERTNDGRPVMWFRVLGKLDGFM